MWYKDHFSFTTSPTTGLYHILLRGGFTCTTVCSQRKIVPELQKQPATLYGHFADEREFWVFVPQVQLQRGATDCGCFAVAFAVSLVFRDDPSSLLYNQKEMRGHLKECLLAEPFTPFLANEKKQGESQTHSFSLNLPYLYVHKQTLIQCSVYSVLYEKLWHY